MNKVKRITNRAVANKEIHRRLSEELCMHCGGPKIEPKDGYCSTNCYNDLNNILL